MDRWSDSRTWSGGEIPLAGDTVVIPPGQAVLLDVPADLYLLLVQGLFVMDHKDLTLDAFYIWVCDETLKLDEISFLQKV